MPCEPGRHLAAWPRGRTAEESITAMADGLRDGRETSGSGDRVITDKLVPFDLQQLSLAGLRLELVGLVQRSAAT